MFGSSPERRHTGCPQNRHACLSFLRKYWEELLISLLFPLYSHHLLLLRLLLVLLLLNRQEMHTGQCPGE